MPRHENNLSELAVPAPVENENEARIAAHRSLESTRMSPLSPGAPYPSSPHDDNDHGSGLQDFPNPNGIDAVTNGENGQDEYTDPSSVANLPDTAPDAVVENPHEARRFTHHNLEEELGQAPRSQQGLEGKSSVRRKVGRVQTTIFILAYLVVFSILGTLARLGLTALTGFAAQPVGFTSIWPNFAGSMVLGFLSEGAQLFRHPQTAQSLARPAPSTRKYARGQSPSSAETSVGVLQKGGDSAAAHESALPVPFHIGLATGFCGSFTSFSAFMRDSFEALAGMLGTTTAPPSPGQDFMALAAVIIATLASCITGLRLGAHVAIFIQTYDRKLPRHVLHVLDRVAVVLAVGLWVGAVIMTVVPPDRPAGPSGSARPWELETWRGQVLFALVFAPLGCLCRFVASTRLNACFVGFPFGTFCVNMFGTLLLAAVWDLQRLPAGRSLVSCQVLQGIEDGFCGCLTTVSTWVLELNSLRRVHAYRYGLASLFTGLAVVVIVMGSLKWSVGLKEPVCAM